LGLATCLQGPKILPFCLLPYQLISQQFDTFATFGLFRRFDSQIDLRRIGGVNFLLPYIKALKMAGSSRLSLLF
jgi:hypothetical protein